MRKRGREEEDLTREGKKNQREGTGRRGERKETKKEREDLLGHPGALSVGKVFHVEDGDEHGGIVHDGDRDLVRPQRVQGALALLVQAVLRSVAEIGAHGGLTEV